MSKEQEKPVVKVGGSPLKSVTVPPSVAEEDSFITFGKTPLNVPKNEETPVEPSALGSPEKPEDIIDQTEEVEDEQEEEIEETPSEEESEEEEVNPYEFLGKQLQSDGFLDKEFEIKKDIQGTDLYNAFSQKLKKEIEPQVKQSVYEELAEQGINNQDLIMARLIRSGVDVSVLQNNVLLYERLAAYDKNLDENQKEYSVKHMYAAKGFEEDEANVLIAKAKEDDRFEELYSNSSKFFGEKYKEFVEKEIQESEHRRRQQREMVEKEDSLVKSKLSSGEIYGEKIDKQLAKEIHDAIYRTDDIVEIGGNKHPASKFHKFMLEFNNNPELRVWAYKKWAYRGGDLESIKKETKKELEQEFLEGYKNSVLKNKKSKKITKDKLQDNVSKNGKSYIIEF